MAHVAFALACDDTISLKYEGSYDSVPLMEPEAEFR
ncbi:hypothetical protein AWB81_06047 [Caballeronia arationis]|jgi:hypothetical protein|nr:hypothetical protein AWB81_06047 [Caballeronia arationis]